MDATTIAVDLAKTVFEVAVADYQCTSWRGITSAPGEVISGRNSIRASGTTFRLNNHGDYRVFFATDGRGSIVVDDVRITDRNGQLVASENAEGPSLRPVEFSADRRHSAVDSGTRPRGLRRSERSRRRQVSEDHPHAGGAAAEHDSAGTDRDRGERSDARGHR